MQRLTFTASNGKIYIMCEPKHWVSQRGPTHGFDYWGTRDGKRFGPVRMATNHGKSAIYRDGIAAWDTNHG